MIKFKIICFIFLTVLSFSSKLLANTPVYVYEVIAENLDHPWGIAILDNDDLLVTELSGRLRLIKNGALVDRPIEGIPEVLFAGQGGLSGIAIDPSYSENKKIYLAFSSPDAHKKTNSLEVISASFNETTLTDVKTIFRASPSRKTAAHYGARMVFLDDGTLLITSGDGFNYREKAQYLDNHFGKIIRINTDGSVPEDNPFTNNPNFRPEIW